MAASEPIDPRVRLAISQWTDGAPHGVVWTFCAEHGISGQSIYEFRKRAQIDGPTAVLDHGPISVHDKMRAVGLERMPWWCRRPGSSGKPASRDLS